MMRPMRIACIVMVLAGAGHSPLAKHVVAFFEAVRGVKKNPK